MFLFLKQTPDHIKQLFKKGCYLLSDILVRKLILQLGSPCRCLILMESQFRSSPAVFHQTKKFLLVIIR